jgi:hypothetical protein
MITQTFSQRIGIGFKLLYLTIGQEGMTVGHRALQPGAGHL